jgi:acyl-CoA hydrolase
MNFMNPIVVVDIVICESSIKMMCHASTTVSVLNISTYADKVPSACMYLQSTFYIIETKMRTGNTYREVPGSRCVRRTTDMRCEMAFQQNLTATIFIILRKQLTVACKSISSFGIIIH